MQRIIVDGLIPLSLASVIVCSSYVAIDNLYLPPEPVKILLKDVQESKNPQLEQKFGDLSKIKHKRNNFFRVLWDGTVTPKRANVSCEMISENGTKMLVYGNFLPTEILGYDNFQASIEKKKNEQKEKPEVNSESKWTSMYVSVQGEGDKDMIILKEF